MILLLLLPLVSSLRYSQFEFFKKFALDWIVDLERVEPDVGGTVAGLARLAWHDGGSWDPVSKTGGAHFNLWVNCTKPNACEYTAPEHKGLQEAADNLMGIYNGYGFGKVISRADWLHLAAVVAFEHASGIPGFQIPWRWGRTDAPPHPLPRWPNRLPDAQKGFSEVKRVFSRLGFTPKEAVALIGGHALGKGDPANSGFSGTWTQQPNQFSNGYYQFLLNQTWDQTVLDSNHTQWETKKNPDLFELNTDIALAYANDGQCTRATTAKWGPKALQQKNVNYDDWDSYSTSTKKPSSTTGVSYCARRQGLSEFVEDYAKNSFLFLMDFPTAWSKLNEFGNDNMREACSDTDSDPSCDYHDPYGAPIRRNW